MMHDTAYHLSARDMLRILRLISQLKEAIAELLAHRHVFLPMEEFEDIPTTSELHFYEQADNILSDSDF